MANFEAALLEIKPAFGVDNDQLENSIRGGIIDFGPSFSKVLKACTDFIGEIKSSERTQLLTVLLEGKNGCGKTALAAHLALKS
jgi:vesicle-fusing ATPase